MKTNIKKTESKIIKVILTLLTIIILTQNVYSQPAQDWVSRFNGIDLDDKSQAMAMDKEGNIYVTGYSEGKGSGKDFLTIKYSSKGEEIWSQRFQGIGFAQENEDVAKAIAVDENNNVFVTGYSSLGRAGVDYCTIKYNEKGQEEWVMYFGGLGNIEDSHDEATSIATDGSGNIYVVGNSDGGGNGSDICIVKYDINGNEIWASKYNGNANGNDYAVSVKFDKSGFVYVAGTTDGIVTGKDYLIARYDKGGEVEWVETYNGMGGNLAINDDEVSALAVDESGNAYITGYSYGGTGGKDFSTIKYNSSGQVEWLSRIDNSHLLKNLSFDDEAKAIAIAASGDVYVSGKTSNPQYGSNYLTVKISSKGEKMWTKVYNSEVITPSYDGAEALAVDSKGNVYVTGFINAESEILDCGNERGIDFCTIKYSSDGEQKWVKDFNGSGSIGDNNDIPKAIFVNGSGKIYVMGETMGEATGLDYCLIKYSEFYPIDEQKISSGKKFELSNNYPNPFNPTTKISFSIPVSSNVKLAIYDITGKEVSLLVNNTLQSGEYQYEWNAGQFSSGTYFYKIEAGGFVQTKKMFLIK